MALGKFGQAWACQGKTTNQAYLHCIPLMVLYHHPKNYQKRSNGLEDIQIWKIEQSDWLRAGGSKFQEPEFSQTCKWCTIHPLHNVHDFSLFPTKTNAPNLRKSKKCPFLHHFGPVLPNLGQIGFFSKKSLHHLKRVTVFYLYAKNYKKRSNGSKDIAMRRIERSNWLRA